MEPPGEAGPVGDRREPIQFAALAGVVDDLGDHREFRRAGGAAEAGGDEFRLRQFERQRVQPPGDRADQRAVPRRPLPAEHAGRVVRRPERDEARRPRSVRALRRAGAEPPGVSAARRAVQEPVRRGDPLRRAGTGEEPDGQSGRDYTEWRRRVRSPPTGRAERRIRESRRRGRIARPNRTRPEASCRNLPAVLRCFGGLALHRQSRRGFRGGFHV